MFKIKSTLSIFLACCFFLALCSGCHPKSDSTQLRVGTISGPETQLMEVAKQVARKKYNLNLKIVQFSDYSLPNAALNEGDLDANLFQHQPFLAEEIKHKHYHLVPIAKFFIYPMGIYSKKIQRLSELRQNAIIAIPNDPSNEARALLLMQDAGLIKLTILPGKFLTPRAIYKNPKCLQIKELDAAQLTRVLPDVDAAVINTNYAVLAYLYPLQNALFVENKNSSYANLLVVREQEQDDPRFKQLINALHSPEVLAAAEKLFHGQALPTWK
jgi:D-methionine transport system substrate-binding protein